MKQWKIVWEAKALMLSGVHFYEAKNQEQAIAACRAKVMRDHDAEIAILECKEVVLTGMFQR